MLINGTLSPNRLQVSPGINTYFIAEALDPSRINNLELLKATNTGAVTFLDTEVTNGTIFPYNPDAKLKIAYFGD